MKTGFIEAKDADFGYTHYIMVDKIVRWECIGKGKDSEAVASAIHLVDGNIVYVNVPPKDLAMVLSSSI